LVAFPTETVYGLGADARSEPAVRAVFEIKGRPAVNPLIVHVADEEAARACADEWPPAAAILAREFWPGPLSIVVRRAGVIPAIVTAGGPNVALRCPDHPTALELLRAFEGPLVGPSANLSGRLSPTAAEHVRASFAPQQVLVLDGGPCRIGIESTVVSVAGPAVRVLRPGVIGPSRMARVLGVGVEYAVPASEGGPMESPGGLESHYAPAARAVLAESSGIARAVESAGGDAVVLALPAVSLPARKVIAMPARALPYAAALYGALREADALGPRLIVIETPSELGGDDERAIWHAVLDRLRRATA
jgi:L-threonylcarbamoyladenylate synthase